MPLSSERNYGSLSRLFEWSQHVCAWIAFRCSLGRQGNLDSCSDCLSKYSGLTQIKFQIVWNFMDSATSVSEDRFLHLVHIQNFRAHQPISLASRTSKQRSQIFELRILAQKLSRFILCFTKATFNIPKFSTAFFSTGLKQNLMQTLHSFNSAIR